MAHPSFQMRSSSPIGEMIDLQLLITQIQLQQALAWCLLLVKTVLIGRPVRESCGGAKEIAAAALHL
jgi:hypothetical protein